MNSTIANGHAPLRADSQSASLSKRYIWGVCGILAMFGLITPNPLLTAFAMLIPAFLFTILWRRSEPPVLAFAAGFQWLQAASPVFTADLAGHSISSQPLGPFLHQAAWLSLIAIVVLAIGMQAGLRRMPPLNRDAVFQISQSLSPFKLFVAYLIGLALSVAFIWVSGRAGGLRQPILALASIKWVPLFLLCWSTLQCDKPKNYMILAVLIELVIGFSGYFSAFKNVLFLLLIIISGVSSDRPKMPKSHVVIVAAMTLFLALFWQAVKVDYRKFLNQGLNQQVVRVSLSARMKFLAKSIPNVTPEKMVDGLVTGVDRLGYITYFAYSIRNVPSRVPHQHGGLWIGAVKHVFMPRILFPDKPELNESKQTNFFTGLRVAGRRQGTAISIGYIGESYIDFGAWLMAIPIFGLGYFYAWIYAFFASRDPNHLVGFAVATAILLFSAILVETSNIKLVGGVTTTLIAFTLLMVFFREKFLGKVLAT